MGIDASVTHTDWEVQRERISAYLDRALSTKERAELEAHLPTCDACQREVAALRQVRRLLRALPQPAPPRAFTLPDAPAAATLRRRREAAPRWSRPAQALGGMAAAVGLGLLIASALPHPGVQYGAAASSNSYAPSGAAATFATAPAQAGGDTAGGSQPTPTGSVTYGPVHAPAFSPHVEPRADSFPTLPVTGGTLLVGGATALTLGSLARRRRGDVARSRAEPTD